MRRQTGFLARETPGARAERLIPEIMIEENELGRPQSPQQEVDRLKQSVFNPGMGRNLRVHINAGAGLEGEIILGRPLRGTGNILPVKVYRLSALGTGGMRRIVRANMELEPWRTHEREWMEAMVGRPALLRDPGKVNSVDTVTELRVTSAALYRKRTSRQDTPPLLGMIELRETIPSMIRRHQGKLLLAAGMAMATALLSAAISTLAVAAALG